MSTPATAAGDYIVDTMQRMVLYADVMRKRGNAYLEHQKNPVPTVLSYDAQLVVDGRKLDRPVNYFLTKITPPEHVAIDERYRPFIVVDPRAGHGPGIGGFKADSEIGVALKAGHPCYFVGFLPDPMPGQTLEDIARAEGHFLETVIAAHPLAEGKPCVIGNCQAGWAMMMLAATRPELFGPVVIAGSPLSYWAGTHGENPMRYTGGLLGGSWLTAFASDIGSGKFDGAWLVQNFENLNPSNTYWTKQYNLYSKVDTEAPRYLGFEKWWGGHVSLNASEIQAIVDELFVGNKLAAGLMQTQDGLCIDLRNIRSPIVVLCSKGDNITPPPQALGWVLDLYEGVDEIKSWGQTIVYTIHETIGHLGIFVSGSVARKEHEEFSSNIDLIDTLPPGLYEAIFMPRDGTLANADMASGDWIMRCEARTLDDIRALGRNDLADDRCFAAAAKVSNLNLALYRAFVQPTVQALFNPVVAEAVRNMHPLKLQYSIFSDANPAMGGVAKEAEKICQQRKLLTPDNPFVGMQEQMSRYIAAGIESWRAATETWAEKTFFAVYGNPLLQRALGIDAASQKPLRHATKSLLHQELLVAKRAELLARVAEGGMREALIRAALYIGMARGAVDERTFATIRRIRANEPDRALPLAAFKAAVRRQYYILLIDEAAAIAALPSMLPPSAEERRKLLSILHEVISASGQPAGEAGLRLERITRLFEQEHVAKVASAAA
jgi:pimeloyl-ACP methyl ester carboxylesterase